MDSVPPLVIYLTRCVFVGEESLFFWTYGAGSVLVPVEEITSHSHYFSFHLAQAGEEVGMQGVGVGGHAVHLGDQSDQVGVVVVDGARDESTFPVIVSCGKRDRDYFYVSILSLNQCIVA
jgi:hypothetical protein